MPCTAISSHCNLYHSSVTDSAGNKECVDKQINDIISALIDYSCLFGTETGNSTMEALNLWLLFSQHLIDRSIKR